MSGGRFNYVQYRLKEEIEKLKNIIEKNNVAMTSEEIKDSHLRFYYPNQTFYHSQYSDEIIEEMKKGLEYMSIAAIYLQRIDFLVSHDDSEESFLENLKEDLEGIE
jgi:hypothetical protein